MKRKGLLRFGMILTIAAAAFTLMVCVDPGIDGDGAGADFDATLYYTKTEVDQKISDAIAATYSDSEIDDAIDLATPTRGTNWTGGLSTQLTSANDSYANGIDLGDPEGANFVMLFVRSSAISDVDGFNIYGGYNGEGDPRFFNVPSTELSLPGSVFFYHIGGDGMKFWVEGLDDAGATLYLDTVWFRERNEN